MKDADGAAASINRALRPGGRFVAELAVTAISPRCKPHCATSLAPSADQQSPWYYPSIGEYAPILERHGFEVRNASLFDRPTPLEGENGLDQWLRMFTQTYLRQFSPERADEIVAQLVEVLRPRAFP